MSQSAKKTTNEINYQKFELGNSFLAVRFIFESGLKLQLQSFTICSAAYLFHRFFRQVSPKDYDHYLVATSSLHVSSKMNDDYVSINNLKNVIHDILHQNQKKSTSKSPEACFCQNDSIVQCASLILRMLKFDIVQDYPQKYLFKYLTVLDKYLSKDDYNRKRIRLSHTSFSLLHDFFYEPTIIDYKPQHIAIAVISLSLQCYGIVMPSIEAGDDASQWYRLFCNDLSNDTHWQIIEKVIDNYNKEPKF